MPFSGFEPSFFKFFRDLSKHNDRAWFEANKDRYREQVVAVVSAFITDLAPKLGRVSTQVRCDPRPNGGSMFRIHRDVRFAKDKTPYKTHASAHFRHVAAKDAHAPGFYLHLEPGKVMFGGGVWMPDPPALHRIRTAIAEDPKGWSKAKGAPSVKKTYGGLTDHESLARPPKGFDPAHEHVEDLRRKSFFVMRTSTEKEAGEAGFVALVAKSYADAAPVMRFLCEAVGTTF